MNFRFPAAIKNYEILTISTYINCIELGLNNDYIFKTLLQALFSQCCPKLSKFKKNKLHLIKRVNQSNLQCLWKAGKQKSWRSFQCTRNVLNPAQMFSFQKKKLLSVCLSSGKLSFRYFPLPFNLWPRFEKHFELFGACSFCVTA